MDKEKKFICEKIYDEKSRTQTPNITKKTTSIQHFNFMSPNNFSNFQKPLKNKLSKKPNQSKISKNKGSSNISKL